ncbi:MAG: DUF1116 domain-containing protein [Gammaproteobacteria bacterium]|nr:DUF1116 domain-containing protein [Gammaproteobacteria bacterium]
MEESIDGTGMTNIDPRDHGALKKMLQARPVWDSNELAANAIGLDDSVILHAGPPFNSTNEIPEPVMNSAAVALVFEKHADDFDTARAMIRSGEIRLQPAQNHSTVVPLAGVVSASMWLHKIIDANDPNNVTYSPLNGGNGPAMRLGLCSESALSHLRWINQELIEAVDLCQDDHIDLLDIAKIALENDDDCHGRTIAATHELVNRLKPAIDGYAEQKRFLNDSPSFALNHLMAASKCLMLAADAQSGSGMVTAAGGNGVRTGIQVSNEPGNWITESAASPEGDLGEFPKSRALGAIGDSAVVDMIGFGAMAVAYSNPQREMFGTYLPDDADELPYKLLLSVHDAFSALEFRTGLSVRTVVAEKTTPIVSLGVIDREGIAGRLGGGIFRYPLSLFQSALDSIGR